MSESSIQRTTEHTKTTETVEQTPVKEHQDCPECGGRLRVDDEHAEITCEECGLIVDEGGIDRGPEWRTYEDGERTNRSRVGAPTTKLMHDEGLSTVIGWQNRDSYGRSLNARQRSKMQRLRTWDERFRTRSHKERNLKQALGEINRMGSALGLPGDVRETAGVIYRRALEEDLLPGRTIEGVATSALYAAARQADQPRSIDEIAAVSRVSEIEFKRTYRYVVRELNLPVKPANPRSFVRRIASALELDEETEEQANAILREAEGTGVFNGKSPVGLAAAAIYAAGQLRGIALTQDDVSEVANVSNVTIRNRYKELLAVYGSKN